MPSPVAPSPVAPSAFVPIPHAPGSPDAAGALTPFTAPTGMDFFGSRLFARLLWFAPILMLTISVLLVQIGFEQRGVADGGVAVLADVEGLTLRERSEITRGEVRLRYLIPGDADSTRSATEMPLVLLKEIEADFAEAGDAGLQVPIRVSPDSDQIILGNHARGQWVLTFSFAAMALIGGIGLVFLVGGWNRLLAREGDPGAAAPSA